VTRPVIAIHGGAGTIRRGGMTSGEAQRYRTVLEQALRTGYEILKADGSSLDAVIAAVVVMEDSPLFNAGRGAVYNNDAGHELDAAVMDGATLRAGAVTCVRRIRNPVLAARAVMERSPHVLLAAGGAERFARHQGLAMVPATYFGTRRRRGEGVLQGGDDASARAEGVLHSRTNDRTHPGDSESRGDSVRLDAR